MIELPIYDEKGKQVDTLAIDEAALGGRVRPVLLKQAYVMFHANRRQGSARTKSRGMVSGSTRKIYRQKGTGNARMGQVRSNLRKGGGVTFAKKRTREEFKQDMPKKMRRLANRNALLAKLVDSEVKCVEKLGVKKPNAKQFKSLLEALKVNRTCLVALNGSDKNSLLSARNLPDVDTIRVQDLNAFELLNHRFLVVERDSLQSFLDAPISGLNGESKPTAKAAKVVRKKQTTTTAKKKTTKKTTRKTKKSAVKRGSKEAG